MSFDLLKSRIELQNDRALLVPLDDPEIAFAEFSKIIFEEDLFRFNTLPMKNGADLEKYIQLALNEKASGESYPFMIYDKASGSIAGSSRYLLISSQHKNLEIGHTWLGAAYRGTGLNKANKYELLRFAFEELGCLRVQFKADVRNLRSRRAMEKIGAKEEGILRSHLILADGHIRDSVCLSILRDEWEEIKPRIFPEYVVSN